MFRVGRRVLGLCHWKVVCIFIFLFSPSVRLSLVKYRNCFIFSCSSPFSPSSSREDDSTATQAIVTNLPHAYIPLCVPIKTNKQTNKIAKWLVSSLICVLRAILCPSSSPGQAGGEIAGSLGWWTMSKYPEGKLSCLSRIRQLLHFLFFIQSNIVIVIC